MHLSRDRKNEKNRMLRSRQAVTRRETGEVLTDVARSYKVSTISRLRGGAIRDDGRPFSKTSVRSVIQTGDQPIPSKGV